eukprot:jgi/Ulvmu1/6222/UM028_0080.1
MLSRRSSPPLKIRNDFCARLFSSRASSMKASKNNHVQCDSIIDVMVIGSGLAGLSATIAMLKDNIPVTLIEADTSLGGNSCKASSGMNSLTAQANDTGQDFMDDLLSSGGDLSDARLVETLVEDSAEALHFIQHMGVDLSKISQLGGHSHARTHRNPTGPNVGYAMMKPLMEYVGSHDAVQTLTNCRLIGLEQDEQQWIATCSSSESDTGCQDRVIRCRSIVLAAGGFAGSAEAVAKAVPGLAGLPTTNKESHIAGSVLEIAQAAGAQLTQVDQVQVHPTTFVDPQQPDAHSKILAPEALRGHGAILVDAQGKRFVNELATRAVVTAAMNSALKPVWMIVPQTSAEAFGLPAIGFYCSKGLMTKVEYVHEAAEHMNVQPETLRVTLSAYDVHHVKSAEQTCDEFGKVVFPAPVAIGEGQGAYISQVTPAVHYCMGGVKFTANGEVVGKDGNVMPGLFAAGEVTGGLHGRNRLAGSSLLDCVVFGRRAGSAAARYLLANHT